MDNKLTPNEADIIDAIDSLLSLKPKTSPTEICEFLDLRGFKTLVPRGRSLRNPKPLAGAFNAVCDVAVGNKMYSYKIHGNTRSTTLRASSQK